MLGAPSVLDRLTNHKKVFVEPREGGALADVVQQYKNAVEVWWHSIV